jgi:DDB1- and CUL4-associated factor 11
MSGTSDTAVGQTPLDFSSRHARNRFGIMSTRFSSDGREVIAASNSGHIFVYDLNVGMRTVAIEAHEQDVNSCCWADTQSGNVLVSASDDSFLKVWSVHPLLFPFRYDLI